MSGRCRHAWLLVAGAALPAQDPDPPLFVEVDGLPTSVWHQQPFTALVRIGYDAAWFRSSSVPLFQQPLDQPFHVVVPWLQAAEDRAVELLDPPAGAAGQRVAVGDRVLALLPAGQRRRGERTFELLELRCRWLPLAPGVSVVAPVQVRYAFATRFEEDFLRGRQPLDRQELTVISAAASLTVRALPPPPRGFTGAVGEFVLTASSTVSSVAVGQSFPVGVDVTGEGNLERFAPLVAPSLPGFHVQGVVEKRLAGVRRFELDVLALRAGVDVVPPVPLLVFSPARGAYVTVSSSPLPIRVEPLPPGAELPPRVRDLVAADALVVARASSPSWGWAIAAALGVAVGTVLLRQRGRASAVDRALRTAYAGLANVAPTDAAALFAAFEALLATAIGSESWSGEGWSLLAARGVPAAEVACLRDLHATLDAARFGGTAPPVGEVLAVVDAAFPGQR